MNVFNLIIFTECQLRQLASTEREKLGEFQQIDVEDRAEHLRKPVRLRAQLWWQETNVV